MSDYMEKIILEETEEQLRKNPAAVIAAAEQQYQNQIVRLCSLAEQKKSRVIFITGPSSAGKTTTASRIVSELERYGHRTHRVSLDDFYYRIDQKNLPLWEDGTPNWETPESLDIPYLHQCVAELFERGRAGFPKFRFTTRDRVENYYHLRWDDNTVLIVEGLHALNPQIREAFGAVPSFGVYLNVRSDFVSEKKGMVLSHIDLRLARRIIRDAAHRASSPTETIWMWIKVLIGEERYIRPFQNTAEAVVNTTHAYEPWLYTEQIRRALLPAVHETRHAANLLREFEPFFQIDGSFVPSNSLLREFYTG